MLDNYLSFTRQCGTAVAGYWRSAAAGKKRRNLSCGLLGVKACFLSGVIESRQRNLKRIFGGDDRPARTENPFTGLEGSVLNSHTSEYMQERGGCFGGEVVVLGGGCRGFRPSSVVITPRNSRMFFLLQDPKCADDRCELHNPAVVTTFPVVIHHEHIVAQRWLP